MNIDLENIVYLDNSATTKPSENVVKKITDALLFHYGNPSSLHNLGIDSEMLIDEARGHVSKLLGCDKNSVIFASSGSQANNIALLGAAEASKRRGKTIVASINQHASVINALKHLEKIGYVVKWLYPEENTKISLEKLDSLITDDTILASIMYVNNETGAIEPVKEAFNLIKNKNPKTVTHCDAVQAFGKIPFTPESLSADLISVSAHKIHGPKGVGALYINKNCRISPIFFGGSQEKGFNPGTEAVSLISGFGEAAKDISNSMERANIYHILKNRLLLRLKEVDGVEINSPEDAAPFIVNFSIKNIRSEIMLHYLSSLGVYVSSGSACSKGKKSEILTNMGLSEPRVNSALRISFSANNTESDIDALIEGLKTGVKRFS